MKRNFFILVLLFCLMIPYGSAGAQEGSAPGPIYIVQSGDALWEIALRFGVSVDDLITANRISDPNRIRAGDQLIIPGLEGIQGVLVTQTAPFGETLRSLSRRYRVPEDILARLNHLTSPVEVFSGMSLVIPEANASQTGKKRAALAPGQSLLELAVIHNSDPWVLLEANYLENTWQAMPGDVLLLPGEEGQGPGAFPTQITAVELTPSSLAQGNTLVLRLRSELEMQIAGQFLDRELHFFRQEDGSYVSLQGIHAMTDPGAYELSISGYGQDGTPIGYSQRLVVRDGGYPFDPSLAVDPATIDLSVTRPEDEMWNALAAPLTPQKLWEGLFSSPVDEIYSECWPSRFGSRRSYNQGPYTFFHSGLDFCGGVGNNIYAPALGNVVFTGPLTVRGISTVIDHGWGVYTAYMHQSESLVEAGDRVEEGQLIGLVGATGRVTGPHLHWEIWVGGVQVDPLDWLGQAFP